MKKSVFTFIVVAASMMLLVSACDTTKKMQDTASTAAASDPLMVAWNKNLDGFHSVMSSTFHPAEEGNLAPLKANAATMADKATAWAKAELPSGMKGKGVEAILKKPGGWVKEPGRHGEIQCFGSSADRRDHQTARRIS
ncbi:MAG: hypothetical protein IPK21_16450 [Haliscomenobacter sp.]|nr:hypothetical protein [Haliscomenobacter sp.]